MLRASWCASACLAVVALGWGCGNSVSDSSFTTSSSSGAANGGAATQGVGGTGNSGGAGQGGATGGGNAQSGGAGPGVGGSQGGAGQGGSGNAGPGGGGAGVGGGTNCPGVGDPCSRCAASQCSATYCGCYVNASCDKLSVCFSQCQAGDATCYQSCETANPDGISAYFLLENCSAGACMTQCPGTAPLNACQVCLFTKCDTEMNACVANPECTAILGCVAQCAPANMSCPTACVAQHPMGASDAQAVGLCSNSNCSSACP